LIPARSTASLSSRSKSVPAPFTGPAWWVAAVALAVALLLQTEVLHFFAFRHAEISAVLVVVIWYALHADLRRAALFGLIAGACEDVLATQTGAAFTISTTVTAALAGTLSSRFFSDSIPLGFAIMFGATVVRDAFFWTVLALQGYPGGYARMHVHESLWQALLNALVLGCLQLIARRRAQLAER